MKRNRSILNWLLLLMMTVGMTSCEELADAFFADEDNPTPDGSSTTTPDILIDNATLTLSVGQTASREASVNSADIQLTYASSTPAVATVSQTGKVTAITAGETTITVSAPQISKSVSFKVVVNAIPADQLAAVDKATPLTFLPQDDGKITVTFYNGITLAGDIPPSTTARSRPLPRTPPVPTTSKRRRATWCSSTASTPLLVVALWQEPVAVQELLTRVRSTSTSVLR